MSDAEKNPLESMVSGRAETLGRGDLLVLAAHTIEVREVAVVLGWVVVRPDHGRPLRYRVGEQVQVVRVQSADPR